MEGYTERINPKPRETVELLVPPLTFGELCDLMIRAYGAAVSFPAAGRMIGKGAQTVKEMVKDGRLTPACEGERVEMTSIVRYILAPKKIDFEARAKKRMEKTGCKYYV